MPPVAVVSGTEQAMCAARVHGLLAVRASALAAHGVEQEVTRKGDLKVLSLHGEVTVIRELSEESGFRFAGRNCVEGAR